MPTDTCVIESREREHEQIATKANAEKEIDKAIKWVREEDKKMDEKYSRGPQPEQSMPYHIVRSLIKALQQAERERDAAINEAIRAVFYDMSDGKPALLLGEGICRYCQSDKGERIKCKSCFENGNFELRNNLRGLPQEGEGV